MKVDRRAFLSGSAVAALAAKGGIVPRAVKAESVRQALIARGVKL